MKEKKIAGFAIFLSRFFAVIFDTAMDNEKINGFFPWLLSAMDLTVLRHKAHGLDGSTP